MESKTVKGIVEFVNPQYNSVKLKDGETFSGKFSYKGALPNIGDEVVLTVVENKGKDGKLYWNITEIVVVVKAIVKEDDWKTEKEKSIISQCLCKIVFGDKGADAQLVFDTYQNFLTKM